MKKTAALCLTRLEERATPADVDVTFIERTPRYDYDAVKNNPAPGDQVTFTGHVKNWDGFTPSVNYVWRIDGVTLATGTLTNLAAGAEKTLDLGWTWQNGPHTVELILDPDNQLPEESELNNAVTDRTDGLAVGFWVEQSVYDYFRQHQRELNIGSNSWEDWAQRQVATWNRYNAEAVYPLTPEGVRDRVRLDKVVIVPDGTLPLHGGLASNNPDSQDKTVDLMWGFESDLITDGFYSDTTNLSAGNHFYVETALLHELGHARYLIDYYAMDVANNAEQPQVQILENGAPVAGSPLMPFIAWGEVLYYNRNGGLMGGQGQFEGWSEHEAKALNLIAGRRASQGNQNSPGNIGVYLQDLPERNHLVFTDGKGGVLAGAKVEIYRAVPVSGVVYGKVIDDVPDFTLTADAWGQVDLPKNPFTDAPFSYDAWVPSGVAAVRVEYQGHVFYRFIELPDFNLEYWRGHTSDGYVTLSLEGTTGVTPPINPPPVSPPVVPPTIPPTVPSPFSPPPVSSSPARFAVGGPGGAVLMDGQGHAVKSFGGGQRVASGDFNGDGSLDVAVGSGPGVSTQVTVYDGLTGGILFSVQPFEAAFTGGVWLSAGDVDRDGKDELAVSPDEGGGPRVRVFQGGSFTVLADFMGIDDPNFRGGARTALGDVNGDGSADLIVAAGFGGGPRVAVFNGRTLAGGPQRLVGDFFAFEEGLRNGAYVGAGDMDGDGRDELAFGGGPGGGPRVWVSALGGGRLVDFFAGNPAGRNGDRVALADLDGDGRAELITADGGTVRAYSAGPSLLFEATPGLADPITVG